MSSTHTLEVELTANPHRSTSTEIERQSNLPIDSNEANNGFSLKPTDGGKDAWLFLLSCFMLEALIWGFPASYGVFQEYYSSHEPFAGQGNIAVVGAVAMGFMYMDITVIFALLKRYPRLRMWSTPVGLAIAALALGLGSFSKNVTHLIITQGLLYAIGGGIAWTPILFFIEEWWVRRRGFAYGATMAGLGMSGAILPVVLEWLLNSYGFETTLRVCAIAFVVLNLPILFFFRPRLPLSQTSQQRGFDLSFLKSPFFLIFQSANIMQSIGYFLPAIYMPTFARSLGASTLESIVTVILLNASAFVGSLTMGVAVDKYHVTTCLFVSAIGSTLGVFLLWGFSTSLAPLYIFCVVYGAFAGCQSSSWSAIMRDTKERKRGADSGMIFAFLSAGKGIGNVASGPLSEALLKTESWRAGFAYGSGYGPLIVFTGVSAILGGWTIGARRLGWL